MRKYLEMFDRLKREPAVPLEPAAGFLRAPPPQRRAGRFVAGRHPEGARGAVMPQVHQVLASLGYGDAIGNEVIGIQRALAARLRLRRFSSRPADPRLEDLTDRLPRDAIEASAKTIC